MLAGLFVTALASTRAVAADGVLDPTYGFNGITIQDLVDNNVSVNNLMIDSAMQADDKMLVINHSHIARFTTAGALDPTFDADGVVTAEGLPGNLQLETIAVQTDGRIVVAGLSFPNVAVARLMPDGSIDMAFGSGGIALLSITAGGLDIAHAVAITPDGKIAVAGRSFDPNLFGSNLFVARFKADGTPDLTFGGAGFATLGIPNHADNHVLDMKVQADGKILIGGQHRTNALLARYTVDGLPDASFNGTGIIVHTEEVPGLTSVRDIVIQPDGLILASSRTLTSTTSVIRYHPDGAIDTTFVGPQIDGRTQGLALQIDGRLIVVAIVKGPTGHEEILVQRVHADGSIDPTFGASGFATVAIAGQHIEPDKTDAHIQHDGRIVVAGDVPFITTSYDWVLARLDGPPPISLQFYLGGEQAGTGQSLTAVQASAQVSKHELTLTAPAPSTLSVSLLDGGEWTSAPLTQGHFLAGTEFRLHVPCTATLNMGINLTFEVLSVPAAPAAAATLGRVTRKTTCAGPLTIGIPVVAALPASMSGRAVRLMIHGGNPASPDLDLELGAGTFLEITRFFGKP